MFRLNLSLIILLLFVGCSKFFEAKQQVFICKRSALDGETLPLNLQDNRYFHFNDLKLNVSVGPVGVGLSDYDCEKSEFVFNCKDTKVDNLDDQITLDRYTLFAQQVINTTEKTSIIDYKCDELTLKVE